MIITRSPLRITLGGGGTDLESYYSAFGGFFISAAIDKYVYVSVSEPFKPGFFIKYSKLEEVEKAQNLEHPLIRSMLLERFQNLRDLEFSSFADVPAGTGLGSSGAFAVAGLRALSRFSSEPLDPIACAELAYWLENKSLKETSGKQDPYASALGGLRAFTISQDGAVTSQPIALTNDFSEAIEGNLHLYFTGLTRRSSEVLLSQDRKSKSGDKGILDNLHLTKELGYRAVEALERSSISELGNLFNLQWEQKLSRSPESVNERIHFLRNLGLASGAIGAKLIGAGGGGFLLFAAEPLPRFLREMESAGVRKVSFSISHHGVQDVI